MNEISSRVALVTGASRGIGRAVLLALAAKGYTVIGTATSERGASELTALLQSQSYAGIGVVMNIADQHSVAAAMALIRDQFDGPHLLVNNAGITRDNIMLRMKDEQWDDVISTNLSGTYHVIKACLKAMVKARWGRVINIASVSGCIGNAGQANYSAAKAGVIAMTKSIAREVASRGITANCVAPGFTATDMVKNMPEKEQAQILDLIPVKHMATPEEIAYAVSFLADDLASSITGETLHVNGGLYMA